jgi:hypothetical protein
MPTGSAGRPGDQDANVFLNREPWGKAPRQNATILNKKGNKYLQQAQQEVRQTENGERGQKAKRPKGQKS